MNYFNKLIVSWGKCIEEDAQKIAEGERVIQELKRKEANEKRKKERQLIALLRKEIYEWYDNVAKEININEFYYSKTNRMMDFGVDDTVVLNYYGLRHDSSNGWDSGAMAVVNRGGGSYEPNPKPITCKITKIYVDLSFVGDLIDKFTEKYSYDEIKSWDCSIVNCYQIWLERRYNNSTPYREIMGKYGLYVTARFDVIDYDFQPKWGLNIFSFLNVESDDGKITLDTWDEVYKANIKINELKEKEGDLMVKITKAKKRVLKQFN